MGEKEREGFMGRETRVQKLPWIPDITDSHYVKNSLVLEARALSRQVGDRLLKDPSGPFKDLPQGPGDVDWALHSRCV